MQSGCKRGTEPAAQSGRVLAILEGETNRVEEDGVRERFRKPQRTHRPGADERLANRYAYFCWACDAARSTVNRPIASLHRYAVSFMCLLSLLKFPSVQSCASRPCIGCGIVAAAKVASRPGLTFA